MRKKEVLIDQGNIQWEDSFMQLSSCNRLNDIIKENVL